MSVSMDHDDVRGDIVSDVSAQIEVAITKQIRPPMAAALKGLLKILIGLPGPCHLSLLQLAETDFLRIEGWATI